MLKVKILRVPQWPFVIAFAVIALMGWSYTLPFAYGHEQKVSIESLLEDYTYSRARNEAKIEQLEEIVSYIELSTPVRVQAWVYSYYAMESIRDKQRELAKAQIEKAKVLADAHTQQDVPVIVGTADAFVQFELGEQQDALVQLGQLEPLVLPSMDHLVAYFYYINLAHMRRVSGDNEGALEAYFLADERASLIDDNIVLYRQMTVIEGISRVYSSMMHYEQAYGYLTELIDLFEKQQLKHLLGRLYLFKGVLEGKLELHQKAEQSFMRALAYGKQFNDVSITLLATNNYASQLLETGKYQEAEETLKSALELVYLYNNQRLEHVYHFNIGFAQVFLGRPEGVKLLEEGAQGLKESEEISDTIGLLDYLIRAYKHLEDYPRTVALLQQQIQLQEELRSKYQNQTVTNAHMRFKVRAQLSRLKTLEQQNELQRHTIQNNSLKARLFFLSGVAIAFFLVVLLNLLRVTKRSNTTLIEMNQQLKHQSTHDALTSLLNRRAFKSVVDIASQRNSDRNSQKALLVIDLDHFKAINDTAGHAFGDAVLVHFAKRLKSHVRATDVIARFGGEEFVALLKGIDADHLINTINKLHEALTFEPIVEGDLSVQLSVTMGYVPLSIKGKQGHILSWEQHLTIADAALYYGKQQGRNCTVGVMNVPLECLEDESVQGDLFATCPYIELHLARGGGSSTRFL